MWLIGYGIVGLVVICLIALALIGALVVYYVVLPAQPPCDESNRFNKLRILWWVLTHLGRFAVTYILVEQKGEVDGEPVYTVALAWPWLRNDETENLKNVT